MGQRADRNKMSGGSHVASAEFRNRAIGYEVEEDRESLVEELRGYLENPDVSRIGEHATNNQREVLTKVLEKVVSPREADRDYLGALGIVMREDIQITDRVMWLLLRLNRVNQGYREGTTDTMDFPHAKLSLINRKDQLLEYADSDQREHFEMALENVANSRSGTTENGLEELELTKNLLRQAIKGEFRTRYETQLPPHQLEGTKNPGVSDQKYLRGDINKRLNNYLLLYESLTIQSIRQKELTKEKEFHLILQREQVLASLDSLAKQPGAALSAVDHEKFLEKISVMDSNALERFNTKVVSTLKSLKKGELDSGQAREVIDSWFTKKFTKEEWHRDLEEEKQINKRSTEEGLTKARSNIAVLGAEPIRDPIHDPVRNPVRPEDLKNAA